ncbi:TPA: hypothetical protein ACYSCZ_002874 [Klebsiella oxytoca]
MRRYTVILSDHAGYVDYHVQADTREVALERAIKEHCAHDTEEEKEERERNNEHKPRAIFIYSGWVRYASK